MAIRDIFKFSRKTFINPSGWLDYDSLSNQTTTLYSVLKSMFSPAKAAHEETFEQAMQRQEVTEKDLTEMSATYQAYTILFLVLGIALFCYSLFLLFAHHSITGLLLGLGATAMLLGQAFKYDFWRLQITKRKLGLTLGDWKRHFLGEKGN